MVFAYMNKIRKSVYCANAGVVV